ncbi:acetyl-CoA synthetase-like protein [Rickenella mellea]|uniref:Acetyl-CoA synthetase-like protein n=1 Tax=Rickenella mellea TaxID=50990 RepID=A0A4Y7QBK3_9AGAM|nr:acetyl-CoA synthetase-like protein [Rickenella mellea]
MVLQTVTKRLLEVPRRVSTSLILQLTRNILTQSIVQGPTSPPLVSSTLPAYFEQDLLPKHSTRPALICKKERPRAHGGPTPRNLGRADCLAWDFGEFHDHIEALARGLIGLGVKKGDRVGVVMGNNSAYASLQWACASIGAILVTINPAYRISELITTLNTVGVSTLFLVPRIRTSSYLESLSVEAPSLKSSHPGNISAEELPHLRHLVIVDNTSDHNEFLKTTQEVKCAVDFREILVWREDGREKRTRSEILQSLDKDDVINLQFTSGTTGLPKAVSLTHHNLLNNALSIGRCMRLTPQDMLCNVPPLFHCIPSIRLVLGNLAAWSHASCIVYASEIFDPAAIVDAVTQERCTALHGVPTHFLGVLAEVDKRKCDGHQLDFRRLRTGIAAGSPIPIELMRTLISKLNLVDLTNAYGMTETSPVSFQTTPDDPIIKRTDTVGKVQPHVKARLIDADGDVVPIGTPGEICVSGYLVQKGYWGDDEQTASVMKRHADDPSTVWMHTGDVGIMDEEGYVKVVSRMKDIVIRGGENLFPVQIENRLTFHPAISEAAVIAVPDPKYGEVVGAWIVRQNSADAAISPLTREDVRVWVAEGMNPQNAPAWVWFVGEDGAQPELPKTASGKVMKHVLRAWAKELATAGVGRTVKL